MSSPSNSWYDRLLNIATNQSVSSVTSAFCGAVSSLGYRYDAWVRDTSSGILSRTGVEVPETLIKLVHLAGFAACVTWLLAVRKPEVEPEPVPLPKRETDELPQDYLCLPLLGGQWDNREYESWPDRDKKLNFIWTLCDTDRENERITYHALKTHVVFRNIFNGRNFLNKERWRDISDESLFYLGNYRENSVRDLKNQVGTITKVWTRGAETVSGSSTRDNTLPAEIVRMVERYYFTNHFEDLHPDTRVTMIPGIGGWHHTAISSVLIFGSMMSSPDFENFTDTLERTDREKLFRSVSKTVLDPQHIFTVNAWHHIAYKSEEVLDTWSTILSLRDGTVAQEFKDKLNQIDNVNNMCVKTDRRSAKERWECFTRIARDPEAVDYLPESIKGAVRKELYLYSLIFEQLVDLTECFGNGWSIVRTVEGLVSRFNGTNLLLIDDRSLEGGEGFVCRNTYNEDFQLNLITNNSRWHPDQPNFVSNSLRMVKSQINHREPSALEDVLRLLCKGIGFHYMVARYDQRAIEFLLNDGNNQDPWNLTTCSLYEVASLWGFKVTDYLINERDMYVDLLSQEYKFRSQELLEDPTVKSYMNRIYNVLQILPNEWLGFCLRNMDTETALRVIERTDLDVGTLISAGREMVVLYDNRGNGDFPDAKENCVVKLNDMTAGLRKFNWHDTLVTRTLKEIKYVDCSDNIRLDFLNNLGSEHTRSPEVDLYLRIYASINLRTNLIQEAIALSIYSGLSMCRAVSTRFEGYDSDDFDPIRTLPCWTDLKDPKNVFYRDIKRERDSLYSQKDGDYEETIPRKIEELLLKRREFMDLHETDPFARTRLELSTENNTFQTYYDTTADVWPKQSDSEQDMSRAQNDHQIENIDCV